MDQGPEGFRIDVRNRAIGSTTKGSQVRKRKERKLKGKEGRDKELVSAERARGPKERPPGCQRIAGPDLGSSSTGSKEGE